MRLERALHKIGVAGSLLHAVWIVSLIGMALLFFFGAATSPPGLGQGRSMDLEPTSTWTFADLGSQGLGKAPGRGLLCFLNGLIATRLPKNQTKSFSQLARGSAGEIELPADDAYPQMSVDRYPATNALTKCSYVAVPWQAKPCNAGRATFTSCGAWGSWPRP